MKTFASVLALAAAAALPIHAHAADSAPTIEAALQEAQRQHKPLLVDFHAAWCYSCYYMASHVLNGKEWNALNRQVLVVEADADSPDGHQWMDKLKIRALPSYVVLDDQGQELGRVLAEQPRQKFYPQIDAILAHGSPLDALQKQAQAGSLAAVAEMLDAYQARGQGAEGLAWWQNLPATVRNVSDQDQHVALARARLQLLQARAAKDDATSLKLAQQVLAGDIGCDRSYVLDDLLEASAKLPAAQRQTVLAPQKPLQDRFLSAQVFADPVLCADQRSAVLSSADLDQALGLPKDEQAVLDHAITLTRQRLGGKLGSDRNLADNLRVYLTRAKRTTELDNLQRQLISAYPDDYVYAYRYGRSLLEANQPQAALPYLQQALDKAYGVNRLTVAALEVKALQSLQRDAEAAKVVDATLAANGPWFPKQAQALKASLKS